MHFHKRADGEGKQEITVQIIHGEGDELSVWGGQQLQNNITRKGYRVLVASKLFLSLIPNSLGSLGTRLPWVETVAA